MLIERQPTVFIFMSFHFSHSVLSIFREIFYVDKLEVLWTLNKDATRLNYEQAPSKVRVMERTGKT